MIPPGKWQSNPFLIPIPEQSLISPYTLAFHINEITHYGVSYTEYVFEVHHAGVCMSTFFLCIAEQYSLSILY
jgi:hypothetical protein